MKSRASSPQSRSKTAAAPTAQSGEVRIISGQWRGRKLPVLDVQGLRPTTDRVKETLFNWLMHDTRDRLVLDCFSGSGSLAFEALSRYAKSALLIERDQKAALQLKQNLARLNCSNAEVRHSDTMQLLATAALQQFDLVFIDPPFRQNLALPCARLLCNGWLKPEALIYLETEKELDISELPPSWRLLKDKIAGQLAYRLFQYQPEHAD